MSPDAPRCQRFIEEFREFCEASPNFERGDRVFMTFGHPHEEEDDAYCETATAFGWGATPAEGAMALVEVLTGAMREAIEQAGGSVELEVVQLNERPTANRTDLL